MKKISIIFIAALTLLSLAACGSGTEKPDSAENETVIEAEPMPDSELYYGEILEIKNREDGSPASVRMNSQAKGELVLNISESTVWLDSGNFVFDDSELNVGDRMYVFHSPAVTMSLPPQSAAFAIVRNIPMDARCAMYHEIEGTEQAEDKVIITTDNSEMKITADAETEVFFYNGDKAELQDITPGGHMMVLYREVMNQAPENPEAFKIMLID